jgi:hypothetical protein
MIVMCWQMVQIIQSIFDNVNTQKWLSKLMRMWKCLERIHVQILKMQTYLQILWYMVLHLNVKLYFLMFQSYMWKWSMGFSLWILHSFENNTITSNWGCGKKKLIWVSVVVILKVSTYEMQFFIRLCNPKT